MKRTNSLLSFALLAVCAPVSTVMATNGDLVQEEPTLPFSQKAPLSGEQLNILPSEIQSNIHRMMGAYTLDKIPSPDGTPTIVYAVESEHPQNSDEITARQRVSNALTARRTAYLQLLALQQDVAPAGTPLAEEVLRRLGSTSMTLGFSPIAELNNCHVIAVHNIGDVQKADFRYQNLANRYILNFENAQEFVMQYDQYKPFLEKAQDLHLNFDERTCTPQAFQVALEKFIRGFSAEQPKGWNANEDVPLPREISFNIPYVLIKDLLSSDAQDAADATIPKATDQKTNYNYVLVELSKGMPASQINPAFAEILKQLSCYWTISINRH
ncbi:MAG: hypothetical protein H2057_01195 [Alphaproteobacteria bacterium]|nr:hypothetical protein [Alphaproteobacteria bacterium]